MFFAKIPRHIRQNAITEGDLECILTRNCEGTEQLQAENKVCTRVCTLFTLQERAQQSWGTPVGESPTMVITSEPYSQIRCVVVIQGTKRMGNVAS